MTNFEYVERRKKLIPIAERAAYDFAGVRPLGSREEWANTWNRVFHSMMDTLARQSGLIR